MPELEVHLDDMELIHKIDAARMNLVLENFAGQCQEARQIGEDFDPAGIPQRPAQIIIQGMGGSGMGGELLRSYLNSRCRVPIYLNRDYNLPAWVKSDALLIALSYSGDTEETLSCYAQARERKCPILGITSGGRLKELCSKDRNPLILLPGGMPPRTTIGYLFFPLLVICARMGLIEEQNQEITETVSLIKQLNKSYCVVSDVVDNPAKKIAYHLHGKLPVIYACQEHFGGVALRWKKQINENAKQPAFQNVFPEATHAEIVGWGNNNEINWLLGAIFLKDKDDHPRNQRRMRLCQRVIGPKAGDMIEVESQGDSLLARIFSLIYLGDYVSYFLGVFNQVDPTPIDVIDYIKKKLARETT